MANYSELLFATALVLLFVIYNPSSFVSRFGANGFKMSEVPCAEGEYYETASSRCQSCDIPCKTSEKECQEYECFDYYTKVNQSKIQCAPGQYYDSPVGECRACSIPCGMSDEQCEAVGCSVSHEQIRNRDDAPNGIRNSRTTNKLFRTKRLTRLCAEGEYYETAIDLCRPCSIPCRQSKKSCRDMGCWENVTTTQPPQTINGDDNKTTTLVTETRFTVEQQYISIGVGITGGIIVSVFLIGGFLFILIKQYKGKNVIYSKQLSEEEDRSSIKSTETDITKGIDDNETDKSEISNCSKRDDDYIEAACAERQTTRALEQPTNFSGFKPYREIQQGTQPQSDLGDPPGHMYYGSVHKLTEVSNEPSNSGHNFQGDSMA